MFPSKRAPLIKLNLLICACSFISASLLLSCNGGKSKKDGLTDSASLLLPGAGEVSPAEKQRIKKYAQDWYDSSLVNRGFNGGIIVAKNGNILFEAYRGTGHLEKKDTITDTTSFHIASVSKTFTAMAVLKLWQDGKLNIDDELNKYFPTFNYPGVTIRSLLNHRSGLPNYVYFMEAQGWNKKQVVKNEDVLDYLVTKKASLTNISAPNTHFAYCNTNYALLALLIEKVSGENYSAFLQHTFFSPLHMQHTFVADSSMFDKLMPSYDWRGQLIPFNFLDAVYGDKNIYSTPHDLLTWDRALTGGKIFSAKTMEEAYTPYSNEKPGVRNYGLGWRMNIYPNGKKMIYHNGWWHGNNASFIRLLQDSATIIVLGNKFNRNIYHAKEIAGVFGAYGNESEEEGEAESTKISNAATTIIKPSAPAKMPKKIIAKPAVKKPANPSLKKAANPPVKKVVKPVVKKSAKNQAIPPKKR